MTETAGPLATQGDADVADFNALAEGADVTQSLDIIDKAELVGVPFVITSMRFHPSEKRAGADFVSAEITLQDNRRFVLNDGSTGIRRQLVQYMTGKRWIDPGEGEEAGTESRYDNPCDKWDYLNTDNAELRFDELGKAHCIVHDVRLLARKGLRRSDYTGKEGAATTFYLS